jgi:CRISPR-associated protein Csh1
MIKELVQFTEDAAELKELSAEPKYGLYICLKLKETNGYWHIDLDNFESVVYTGKEVSSPEFLAKCQAAVQHAWMIDSWKCFDAPAKAIHSCSPYVVAFKKDSLQEKEGKVSLPNRLNNYFAKAYAYLSEELEKNKLDVFKHLINSDERLFTVLNLVKEDFEKLSGKRYIVIFLDEPVEKYRAMHSRYLTEKLFNTAKFNFSTEDGETYGTSGFFNSFPDKKPFLTHQSAPFSISGRISLKEAQGLYDFEEIKKLKLLPNPLPVFIMKDEREALVKLIKDTPVGEERRGYLEIIEEIWERNPEAVANYYLLFMANSETSNKPQIHDFDFVSRFEFSLTKSGTGWYLQDLFYTKESATLLTVKDLLLKVLPPMFNNALVVRRKDKSWLYRWFDKIDPVYCKTHNAALIAMRYRKAFYDFIYKSRRQAVTGKAIEDILWTGIRDDIRLDKWEGKYNTENLNIRTKLNLLFNLHQYFSTKPNPRFMPGNIIALREHLDKVARGEAQIETDEQFVFAAGQVVDRISWSSKSDDKSFSYLEPFLAQNDAMRLKMTIANFFKRYKHAIYSERFQRVSAGVLAYQTGSIRNLLPIFLAGVFSENLLKSGKNQTVTEEQSEPTNN